jgi:hypothetical protein
MSSATSEQILVLLEFLSEHQDLARNYVRSQDGRARTARLWAEITQQLNSLGGAVKTATQWQKVIIFSIIWWKCEDWTSEFK